MAPVNKKSRRDDSGDSMMSFDGANVSIASVEEGGISLPEGKPDGVICSVIDVNQMITDSPIEEICGVPWKLRSIVGPVSHGSRRYSIFVHANPGSESSLWECSFTRVLIVRNRDPAKSRFDKTDFTLNYKTSPKSKLYSMDPYEGFIKNNKMTIEVWIYVKRLTGVARKPRFDFSASGDTRSDVVLMIEGKKVHVNKQYLGLYSEFFQALFFGNFAEKEQNEIKLEDVVYEEFIEMLNVIYPSCRKITDDSAEYLLKLADRFQIACVIERAEEFLVASENVSNTEKLGIADQYKLFKLQDHCLSALTTTQDFKDVKESSNFCKLSDATRAALFDRMVKMAE